MFHKRLLSASINVGLYDDGGDDDDDDGHLSNPNVDAISLRVDLRDTIMNLEWQHARD